MKKLFKIGVAVSVGCFSAMWQSCEKELEVRFDSTQLPGDWKLADYQIFKNDIIFSLAFDTISSCSKDNIIRLSSDHSFTYLEGESKCDNNQEILDQGDWKVRGYSLRLHGMELLGENLKISALTDSGLILVNTVEAGDGVYKHYMAFLKQS